MSATSNLLRSILISPEIISVEVALVVWFVHREPYIKLDVAVRDLTRTELLTGICLLMPASFALCWKILYPSKEGETALAEWPRYPQLRATTLVGLLFVVAGVLCAVTGTLGRGAMPEGVSALLLAIGYAVSGLAFITMFMAALRIRAILLGGN